MNQPLRTVLSLKVRYEKPVSEILASVIDRYTTLKFLKRY